MRLTKETTQNTSNGPTRFEITQLGGIQAGRTLVAILPLIPQFMSLLPKDLKLDDFKDPEKRKAALLKFDLSRIDWAKIGSVVASLTPDEFDRVTVDLLSPSIAFARDPNSGDELKLALTRANLDQLFAGHVWDLFALVGFALSLNYLSFSKGANAAAPLSK